MTTEEMNGLIKEIPFSEMLGMEIVECRQGYVCGRIRMKEEHLNIYNGLHGGVGYSLADTIGGLALHTYGGYYTTVNASFQYLKPGVETEYVYCDANVVRKGNKISLVETHLKNDKGDLLMKGDFTYFQVKISDKQLECIIAHDELE